MEQPDLSAHPAPPAPHTDHEHDDEHEHEHDHEHDDEHEHDHDHDHDHEHDHGPGLGRLINSTFHLHGHADQRQQLASDPALATAEGIRTIWLALGALVLTTILQIVIVALSGSVALLADTIHNFGDALNSIPLLVAFYLARRAATRRYT